MMETFQAGAYWPCRKESAEACARRAETFLGLLSRCDSVYAHWFEQAGSLKKALQLQFEPTFETFMRFFGRKAYQNGPDGFSFSAWTGNKEEGRGSSLMLTCGSCSESYSNVCLLYLPSAGPEAERVLTVSVLTDMLTAMALAWEPDWSVVTSHELRGALSETRRAGTFMGWLTYVSRSRGEVPPLPEPVRVQPVENKGTLIILTPERLTASNPEHIALGRRVQDTLHAQGLLAPVVSWAPAS